MIMTLPVRMHVHVAAFGRLVHGSARRWHRANTVVPRAAVLLLAMFVRVVVVIRLALVLRAAQAEVGHDRFQ